MYLDHFGLRELPFSLTPNTRFRIDLPSFCEAERVLEYGLKDGEGIIKITGEVGTGKTLLCRELLQSLGEEFFTAYLPNPCLTPAQLLFAVAEELGMDSAEFGGAFDPINRIFRRLIELSTQGRRVVVLIDEAQAMPVATIESLRLLTNLETESSKLLQLVLFGQPELDELLARRELRQMRQRITLPHRLRTLNKEEVRSYVSTRLGLAGNVRPGLFSGPAHGSLFQASRGTPRLINVIAHKALLSAYGAGSDRVLRRHIRRAALDTDDAAFGSGHSLRRALAARLYP